MLNNQIIKYLQDYGSLIPLEDGIIVLIEVVSVVAIVIVIVVRCLPRNSSTT